MLLCNHIWIEIKIGQDLDKSQHALRQEMLLLCHPQDGRDHDGSHDIGIVIVLRDSNGHLFRSQDLLVQSGHPYAPENQG